jgi:hypothetical protein
MYINENNGEYLQTFDKGAIASPNSPCPTLCSDNTHKMMLLQ